MSQEPPPPLTGPPADYFISPTPAAAPPPPPAYQVPAYGPATIGAGAGLGLLSQFTGSAAWAIGLGLATIIVPFTLGRVFYVTPIVAFLAGLRAVRAGKVIGGVVGMVLSAIGGAITVIALVTH